MKMGGRVSRPSTHGCLSAQSSERYFLLFCSVWLRHTCRQAGGIFFFHEHIARTYYEPQGGIKVLREEKQTENCIFLQGTLNSTWLPQRKHKPLSGISLLPESSQEYSAPQFRDISGECISLILFKHFLRSGLNYAWVIIYTRSCPFGAWLSNIFFEENGSQRPPLPPPTFSLPTPHPHTLSLTIVFL